MDGPSADNLQREVVLAARDERFADVKRLVEQDPRLVEATTLIGGLWRWTVLYVAALRGHLEIATYLLDNGAVANRELDDGETPLDAAIKNSKRIYRDENADVVDLLMERGAYPGGGQSPLHLASRWGRLRAMSVLLAYDCIDVNRQEAENRYTALHVAHPCSKADAARLLLEGGADPTITGAQGRTPLDIAIKGRHAPSIRLLQEWGRGYFLLTKARRLRDVVAAHRLGREDVAVPYLARRVERGEALPEVEVRAVMEPGWLRSGGTRQRPPMERPLLREQVLRYVLEDMKRELFVECMEVWGRWRV